MSTGTRSNYYNRGIGYILFTAGLVLTVTLGSAAWRGFNTLDWQQTNGIMYRSTMSQTTQLGEQSLFQPDVEYRYQYRGDTYTGNKLYFTDSPFSGAGNLAETLGAFPVGSVQLIYINPKNPTEAVLIRGVQSQLVLGLIFALACFGFGMASFRQRS
jgi:hypothetical protein